MSKKKRRAPYAAKPKVEREFPMLQADTDVGRTRLNAAATGHTDPRVLAQWAKAESIDLTKRELGIGADRPQRIEGWLGESDFAWDGEQAVKVTRRGVVMHDADPHDPRLPNRLSPEQIDRIIYEHPSIAMEGLAKLGRIMRVPMTSAEDSGVHIPPFDPLELKSRVVKDLRDKRYVNMITRATGQVYAHMTADLIGDATVIDTQPIYERWMDSGSGNDMYDLRMAPPWHNALMLYTNSHGNVWAMHMIATDIRSAEWDDDQRAGIEWQPQEPADHKVDWEQVRWVYSVQVYVGGLGKVLTDNTLSMQQTVGPLMIWRIAVYEDGVPADIHWTHVASDVPFHKFNNAIGAFTETLNMCNCVNVHIAVPERHLPRPQRRRLQRYGVTFSEVHIRPVSKSYKGKGTPLSDMTRPLHGVIGHYATYGAEGRGLLFGKHAGRFWIPPHVRGSKEAGEVEQKYVAEA